MSETEGLKQLEALKGARAELVEAWMDMELFVESLAAEGDAHAARLVYQIEMARNMMRAENVGAAAFLAEHRD